MNTVEHLSNNSPNQSSMYKIVILYNILTLTL